MERFEVINVLDFLGVSPKYEGYKYIVDDTIMMMDLVKNNKNREAIRKYSKMTLFLEYYYNIDENIIVPNSYDYTLGGHGYIKTK